MGNRVLSPQLTLPSGEGYNSVPLSPGILVYLWQLFHAKNARWQGRKESIVFVVDNP